MKASAWLVIELYRYDNWAEYRPRITKVLKKRPTNEMAVKVVLDIDVDALQPKIDAMVDAGLIHLEIEPSTPEQE